MSFGSQRAGMIGFDYEFQDNFGLVGEEIEALALRAVHAATRAAAVAANAASTTIDLDLEIVVSRTAEHDVIGGIDSKKRGSTSDVRLAPIFDGGSLGKRRRKLATNRARREEWSVDRFGTEYTAHRHELDSSMGIKPQNFFAKAKAAGRAAMLAELELHP